MLSCTSTQQYLGNGLEVDNKNEWDTTLMEVFHFANGSVEAGAGRED